MNINSSTSDQLYLKGHFAIHFHFRYIDFYFVLFWLKTYMYFSVQFSHSVMSNDMLWTAARQASLSITNSWSLLKLMFFESVMPSSCLILCHLLLLLLSILSSIRVFANGSIHHGRWPKYWSFSFSISPSNEYS